MKNVKEFPLPKYDTLNVIFCGQKSFLQNKKLSRFIRKQ